MILQLQVSKTPPNHHTELCERETIMGVVVLLQPRREAKKRYNLRFNVSRSVLRVLATNSLFSQHKPVTSLSSVHFFQLCWFRNTPKLCRNKVLGYFFSLLGAILDQTVQRYAVQCGHVSSVQRLPVDPKWNPQKSMLILPPSRPCLQQVSLSLSSVNK